MKKYDYDHLEEIEVCRDDHQLYKFKEGSCLALDMLFVGKAKLDLEEAQKWIDVDNTKLWGFILGLDHEYAWYRIFTKGQKSKPKRQNQARNGRA
nr:hypothetical protein [Tanacetum cinerariifolium]